jgi:uncharacterized lipoprotein YmbA
MGGCSRSPQTTFYTLGTLPVGETVTLSPVPCSVAVFPVTLPEFVDRPQLVRTTAGSQVHVLEFHRWAEPLKAAIPRLMADDMARRLGTERVSAYPQRAAGDADYRVVTDFQRFENSGNTVMIDAIWSIRTASGEILHNGRSRLREPASGEGQEELVAAYSRALSGLAGEIAVTLRAVCTRLR